jgi:hypothetical protein
METLMQLPDERSSEQLIYSSLAREIQVHVDTVKRWVDLLSRLHYHLFLFSVLPGVMQRRGRSIEQVSQHCHLGRDRRVQRRIEARREKRRVVRW